MTDNQDNNATLQESTQIIAISSTIIGVVNRYIDAGQGPRVLFTAMTHALADMVAIHPDPALRDWMVESIIKGLPAAVADRLTLRAHLALADHRIQGRA